MKLTTTAVILALGAALISAPARADAAQDAKVCGRIAVAPSTIFQLSQERPVAGNFILATSGSETLETTVNLDGTFCFANLTPQLHRLEAFSDGLSPYTIDVMPIEGQTISVYIR